MRLFMECRLEKPWCPAKIRSVKKVSTPATPSLQNPTSTRLSLLVRNQSKRMPRTLDLGSVVSSQVREYSWITTGLSSTPSPS